MYCIVDPEFCCSMTIRFLLRSDKKDKPVPVWARVRTPGADVWFALDAYILPSRWDKRKGMPRPYNMETDPDLHRASVELTAYLNELRDSLIVYVDQCAEKGQQLTRELLEKFAAKKRAKTEVPRAILPYLDWLIERMRDGSFKHNSQNYDYDTIKTWVVFRNVYERFEQDFEQKTGRVLVWSSIDKAVLDAFLSFLEDYGYLTKTVNKYVICLKSLIKYASIYHHLHNNLECLNYIAKRREVAGCATTKTYLNDAEIEALYSMELEPGSLRDKVRDIFLVGCYTCQRVSDYSTLKRSNFGTTASGTKVIRLVQEKTDNLTVIPVLNDNLQRILEKYDYNLPDLGSNADVLINRYIKNLLKELSEQMPSLKTPFKTVLTIREKNAEKAEQVSFCRDEEGNVLRPKYEIISTHSARRSGITNLYKSNLFSVRQLMSISGHKSETTFYQYVSESSDELADEIAAIMEKHKKQGGTSNEDLF